MCSVCMTMHVLMQVHDVTKDLNDSGVPLIMVTGVLGIYKKRREAQMGITLMCKTISHRGA